MIIKSFSKPVFNIALNFIGDRDLASDLTQEIFIKVYRNIEKFKEDKSFQAWVYAVARNQCIDFWRKHKRHLQVDEIQDHLAVTEETPENKTEKESEIRLLRKLIRQIDPESRIYLTMRDIMHLPYQQIAEKMAVPEGTVKSKINRARLKLTQMVQGAK